MRGRRSRVLICAAFVVAVAFLAIATPALAAGPGWSWRNGTFTALEGPAGLPNVAPLGISPDGSWSVPWARGANFAASGVWFRTQEPYIVGYGVGTTPPAQRALMWHHGIVTELGTLGQNTSSAYGVNNVGHAVGGADVAAGKPVAVLFAHGQVTPLRSGDAYSVASAINNHDLVVGVATMTDGHTWAFSWQAGTMTELPHLDRWDWSSAEDVNDKGQIVGFAVLADGRDLAVEWSNGGVVVLPDLPNGKQRCFAYSINERGDIAGSAMDSNGDSHPVVWSKGQIISVLGTQKGYAMGINDAGRVVGTSETGAGGFHAFLYRNGMTDLGTMLPWLTSSGRAINNQNIVIGCNDYV